MSDFDQARYAPGGVGADGAHEFSWQLTSTRFTDPVILELPPDHVLPVIFVPGIMGSNLQDKARKDPVWRLDNKTVWNTFANVIPPLKDQPLKLLSGMATKSAGERQSILNPAAVEIDSRGAVPAQPVGSVFDPKDYVARHWGEVGQSSYGEFLVWLEQVLNGQGFNPARWSQFSYVAVSAMPAPGQPREIPPLRSGIYMSMSQLNELSKLAEKGSADLYSDDLIARSRFRMPVYACGYNWLDSNTAAAQLLSARIQSVIAENNRGKSRCLQVVLVTHSMGGLVARACQQLKGMQDAIAGIVHGVMPAIGAPVAYRRCKVGMKDEDPGTSLVIGQTGQEVTAVFAQAPGALQLLPTTQYRPGWLTIDGPSGKSVTTVPGTDDPYQDIYRREDRWWGLVRKEWLAPLGGTALTWSTYSKNLDKARDFHSGIQDSYHPTTYVFYGKDKEVPSFEDVHWKLKRSALPPDGQTPPTPQQVSELGFGGVRDDGSNPLHVGGGLTVTPGLNGATVLDTSYWDLVCAKQDGGGDGTVPASSGGFPLRSGGAAIQQQFGLPEIKHEPAYHYAAAKLVTLFSLQKIAAKAKVGT
jgi:pimeloyl-ACP methyl ester carboxylesterase